MKKNFKRFLSKDIETANQAWIMKFLSVIVGNKHPMKNEPVVTYNHMEEDNSSNHAGNTETAREKNQYPISLYMIFVADVILIAAVVYMAVVAIF